MEIVGDKWWRNLLRQRVKNRKASGSISDSMEFLIDIIRTMALWLTKSPTEMSIRDISCGIKMASA